MGFILPFQSDDEWRWRWMYTLNDGDDNHHSILHRVQTFKNKSEERGACVEDGVTVCGIAEKWLLMPGLFSRMGAPRCPICCEKLGIPVGDGAPFNAKPKINEPTEI